jgi:hypothetical protein
VIEWLPTESVDLDRVAMPATSVTGLPRFAAPSLNWTVPVDVPEPGAVAVTVAVKVTDWPNVEGLGELARAVEVPALLTVWAVVPELPPNMASPP